MPNDDYSRSKYIWSEMMGLHMIDTPCANLRLYSVYGPYEDGSRLIPQVIQHGLRGEYPPFVRPNISRDFVYVDDVVEAFVDAALNLKPEDYGGSFNIGTGVKTTIGDIARIANETFDIGSIPSYTMPRRDWDHYNDWYANPTKARERLGWSYKTSLTEGVDKTIEWYKSQGEGWKWPTIKPASR
jgi:dolichol-phosphate mannosyltransferase